MFVLEEAYPVISLPSYLFPIDPIWKGAIIVLFALPLRCICQVELFHA